MVRACISRPFEVLTFNLVLVADLYIVLFDSIRKNPKGTGHGREGFYFGENGEHSLYEVGKALGQALVDLGRATEAEPTTFTKEEIGKYFNVSGEPSNLEVVVANGSVLTGIQLPW